MKDLSDKIIEVKDLIRQAQIILSVSVGTKEFEERKELYQFKIIDAVSKLNSIRESL